MSTTTDPPSTLQSLIYEGGEKPSLKVLDQLLIPQQKVYLDVPNVEMAWSVIRDMKIRGAPLIAIVAVLGLAVDLHTEKSVQEMQDSDNIRAYLEQKLDYLSTSRPTAVNLFNALAELRKAMDFATSNNTSLVDAIVQHAEFMLERDVRDNKNIGKHGADILLQSLPRSAKVTLCTICNTGSLATALHGTALGIVREVRDRQRLESIVALETRPYNQGSRLTAFELTEENMPGAKLIADSMAAAFMRTHHVDACVVGADRVCANGDTANKIGTYHLAVSAKAHGVPFYVASPFTTLDLSLSTGDEIVIEERPAKEFLESSKAPAGINVWNPAFDVTPARYITGIVTEKGVIHPKSDGTFDVAAFVKKHRAHDELDVPEEYTEQTVDSLPFYLAGHAPKAMEVLCTTNPKDLECVEMGDGNLNLVFIVTNKTERQKQIIVKQSLPYVRCVGESWPLSLDRAFFEYTALEKENEACPEFVPSIYHFNKSHGLIAMEYLPPPNIILRKGLIQGIRYPTMAHDMGVFCGKTLFWTSGFHLSAKETRGQVEFWSQNSAMCELTEQVVFTEPYMEHAPNNRWTSPQLDADKKAIEQDVALKHAAAQWKVKFVSQAQALIHADLHSGSVMCAPEAGKTYVIDPEFAFYGPMGFDTGAFIANLFLAYVSQDGHTNGSDYAEWILQQICIFWNSFAQQFVSLWDDPAAHQGFVYGRQTLTTDQDVQSAQTIFLRDLLTDSLGFAGMKMLRRIVGIAHVEDLESIEDADVRAKCERHGLEIAKIFIKRPETIASIEDAVQMARDQKK